LGLSNLGNGAPLTSMIWGCIAIFAILDEPLRGAHCASTQGGNSPIAGNCVVELVGLEPTTRLLWNAVVSDQLTLRDSSSKSPAIEGRFHKRGDLRLRANAWTKSDHARVRKSQGPFAVAEVQIADVRSSGAVLGNTPRAPPHDGSLLPRTAHHRALTRRSAFRSYCSLPRFLRSEAAVVLTTRRTGYPEPRS
jgi:hypothetical protein